MIAIGAIALFLVAFGVLNFLDFGRLDQAPPGPVAGVADRGWALVTGAGRRIGRALAVSVRAKRL